MKHAFERAIIKIGDEDAAAIKESFDNLVEDLYGQRDHQAADGIIMAVVSTGLSQFEVRAFLGIGATRYSRIKARLDTGTEYEEPPYVGDHHAFNDATIVFFKFSFRL